MTRVGVRLTVRRLLVVAGVAACAWQTTNVEHTVAARWPLYHRLGGTVDCHCAGHPLFVLHLQVLSCDPHCCRLWNASTIAAAAAASAGLTATCCVDEDDYNNELEKVTIIKLLDFQRHVATLSISNTLLYQTIGDC